MIVTNNRSYQPRHQALQSSMIMKHINVLQNFRLEQKLISIITQRIHSVILNNKNKRKRKSSSQIKYNMLLMKAWSNKRLK